MLLDYYNALSAIALLMWMPSCFAICTKKNVSCAIKNLL